MLLPLELISHIIYFLAPGFDDDLVGPEDELDHAQILGRCARINSFWHAAAQPALYRRIFMSV